MKRYCTYLVLSAAIACFIAAGAAKSLAQSNARAEAPLPNSPSQNKSQPRRLRIGVLAFRGEDNLRQRWQPLADYLSASISSYRFQLVPVSLVSAPELIKNREIEFLVTNPGHFVELADKFGLAALASRERRTDDAEPGLMRYGAVVFTRADSKIHAFADLRQKELAAVSPHAFGGFQMAWREFRRQNMDPFTDLSKIRFMGFPQDAIVMAVLAGKVDAGTVRSGLLEAMAKEGRLDMKDVRILQSDTQYDYPFQISSSLYPEWPFATLPGTGNALNEKVLLALLDTQDRSIARQFKLRDVWSAPLSYSDARALVRAYRGRHARSDLASNQPKSGKMFFVLAAAMLFALAGLLGYQLAGWKRQGAMKEHTAEQAPEHGAGRAAGHLSRQAVGDAQTEGLLDDIQDRFSSLTTREREILCLICDGQSSKQIAQTLGISPKTVEYHRSNLLQKTKAGTTPHLVQMATRSGLDQVHSPGPSK